ncbi:MAG: hypothetical protein IJK78_04050, partial [Bacteroidales bacterium]|nr:hypothetical protein [Bacteroidales bacterium]
IVWGYYIRVGWFQQPCHASLSAHVIPALACGEHGIYGQKVSRGLWLRPTRIRPSQYENLTLHIGVW